MSYDWKAIVKAHPQVLAATIDKHGMLAVHFEKPTYFDVSGKWFSRGRVEIMLTNAGGDADFNPESTLEYRPPEEKTPVAPAVDSTEHPLVRFRKQHGLSQADVAQRLELTPNFISMVERGTRDMSLKVAMRAAALLGVSVEELANWSPARRR